MKYDHLSLTWRGDLTSVSSTAQHARRMLRPLIEGGAHIKTEPLNVNRPPAQLDQFWNDSLNRLVQAPPGIIHINATPPNGATKNPTGGPTVLYTHWETNQVPKHWLADLMSDKFQHIWVTTQSLCDSLNPKPMAKLEVLPFFLKPIDWKKSDRMSIHGVHDQTFVFGCTGLWNNRKNLSDLVISYLGQFSSMDNVALVIKTNGMNPSDPNERAKIVRMVQEIKKTFHKPDLPQVVLLQDVFSQQAMDSIINRFDCYVSTSRGEGRNITMMKCLSHGKPCVAINTGASKDLFEAMGSSRVLYPVPYSLEPVMQMGDYYRATDMWPRPDVGAVMDSMRDAYFSSMTGENAQARKDLAKKARSVLTKNRLADLVGSAQPFAVQKLV